MCRIHAGRGEEAEADHIRHSAAVVRTEALRPGVRAPEEDSLPLRNSQHTEGETIVLVCAGVRVCVSVCCVCLFVRMCVRTYVSVFVSVLVLMRRGILFLRHLLISSLQPTI